MKINFRSIKCTITWIKLVLKILFLKYILQSLFRFVPDFNGSNIILRPGRQFYFVIFKPECFVNSHYKINNIADLILYLFRRTKQMRIILSKLSDSEKSVKHTSFFVAMYKAKFKKTDREFTVRMSRIFVN